MGSVFLVLLLAFKCATLALMQRAIYCTGYQIRGVHFVFSKCREVEVYQTIENSTKVPDVGFINSGRNSDRPEAETHSLNET